MCRRYEAEASTGDIFRISGGLPHGRMSASRSIPAWQSQLLALLIKRLGTLAP